MTRGINVTSFRALEDLEEGLGVFAAKCLAALDQAEPEIRRALGELEERRRRCEREVARWRRAYEEADRDEDDMSSLARKLEQAEDDLRKVCGWQRRAEAQYQDYSRLAGVARRVAAEAAPAGRAFLRRKIAELNEYVGFEAGAASAREAVSAHGSGSGGGPGAGSPEEQPTLESFPLPPGYRWVRLDEIDPAELKDLPPPEQFKGVGYENTRAGLELLRGSVLPAMQQKPGGADGEYFYDLDRQYGREEVVNSLRGVYDSYFGGDAIRVDKSSGHPYFKIGNGRHRIKAARDMGWDAVPGKVVG